MASNANSRWPQDAIHRYAVRATPDQVTKWNEAAQIYNQRATGMWIASAADFFAWWSLRQRDLYGAATAQLETEAQAKFAEVIEGMPCRED